MPVVTYENVYGEILGETRNGVERDYVPDPLGSVAALIDSSQTKTDSFTYWPYGEERSHNGSSVTPFRFVGTLGYYRDDAGRTYVRARYLLTKNARWQTMDPLWPESKSYCYGEDCPYSIVDPSGEWCVSVSFSLLGMSYYGKTCKWDKIVGWAYGLCSKYPITIPCFQDYTRIRISASALTNWCAGGPFACLLYCARKAKDPRTCALVCGVLTAACKLTDHCKDSKGNFCYEHDIYICPPDSYWKEGCC